MTNRDESSEPEKRFGRAVRQAREDRGWTQAELARQMAAAFSPGYTQSTVAKTEAGTRPIRLNEAFDYATLLRRDLTVMLRGPGPINALTKQLRALEAELRAIDDQGRAIALRRVELEQEAEKVRTRLAYLEDGAPSVARVVAEGGEILDRLEDDGGVDREEA